MRVTAVGVVVPVHDEEALLARCLASLSAAAGHCPVPVHVVLVLDTCTDGSAAVAAAAGEFAAMRTVLPVSLRSVGAARSAGFRAVLAGAGATSGLWMATTDADSEVPTDWLTRGLAYANRGYDAVAGTVLVDDWSEHPTLVRTAYEERYRPRWGHRHVHGANLAVSGEAYGAVGGFADVDCHEDAGLIAALTAAGRPVAWAADLPVLTSGRHRGRSPGGFSGYLSELAGSAAAEVVV